MQDEKREARAPGEAGGEEGASGPRPPPPVVMNVDVPQVATTQEELVQVLTPETQDEIVHVPEAAKMTEQERIIHQKADLDVDVLTPRTQEEIVRVPEAATKAEQERIVHQKAVMELDVQMCPKESHQIQPPRSHITNNPEEAKISETSRRWWAAR